MARSKFAGVFALVILLGSGCADEKKNQRNATPPVSANAAGSPAAATTDSTKTGPENVAIELTTTACRSADDCGGGLCVKDNDTAVCAILQIGSEPEAVDKAELGIWRDCRKFCVKYESFCPSPTGQQCRRICVRWQQECVMRK